MHDISRRQFSTKLRALTGALLGGTQPPSCNRLEAYIRRPPVDRIRRRVSP
ncbi:MAG TPA: hypothetical protein VN901_25635 [Candidatus Acidoferrales bacterium]|nr:hypothetical protein [Candidatus Acidoferrales bacterium]